MIDKIVFCLVLMIAVNNSFAQSVLLNATFKKAAIEKKPVLIIVSDGKPSGNEVVKQETTGEAGNPYLQSKIDEKAREAEYDNYIHNDVPLKKPGVEAYLNKNYLILRLKTESTDFKYLSKKYFPVLLFEPDYFVFSSKGINLYQGTSYKDLNVYKEKDMLLFFKKIREDELLVNKIIDGIRPSATQKELMVIQEMLAKTDRNVWHQLIPVVFGKASFIQRTDTVFYRQFAAYSSREVNAIDSFYIQNITKYKTTFPAAYYLVFLNNFQSKYFSLFSKVLSSYSDNAKVWLLQKPLADSVAKYSPLFFPLSPARLELRNYENRNTSISQKGIEGLLTDIKFYLSYNPGGSFEMMQTISAGAVTRKIYQSYEKSFLSDYYFALQEDIQQVSSFLFKNKIEAVSGQTRETLAQFLKEINVKKEKLKKHYEEAS